MTAHVHPEAALFAGEKPPPVLAACEHFAGSRKLIEKALALQAELGPVFDITADCEDGAAAGEEEAHARMVAELVASSANVHRRLGVRIHDPSHPAWKQDVDIVLGRAGRELAYVTIPKVTSHEQAAMAAAYVQAAAQRFGLGRTIPLHVLVESHGALRDVHRIATLPDLEVLDFGLMDFVSDHHGAIPASQMRSPGQFEHRLIARAKAEIAAAALANGVVPSHNVCLNLKDAEVVRGDAARARNEFGFLRMWSIHPAQIRPIVEAMQPAGSEVDDAAAILLAAQRADWGPTQYRGELHDRATYRYFWQVLRKARATGMAMPDEAVTAFFAPTVAPA